MMDPVQKMRETQAAKIAAEVGDRALSKQDRAEQTYSADARKARQVIRELGEQQSLFIIATAMYPVISELVMKQKLQNATERYALANSNYMREEQLDGNQIVGWMGPPQHGHMPELPPGAPDHKVEFAAAWNDMLRLVCEAAKVGITKPNRYAPIQLQVDVDAGKEPIIMVGATKWD
jgi:hypothetical protein